MYWEDKGLMKKKLRTLAFSSHESFNLLLHRLFLDHNIIFYFKTPLKKIKKKLRKYYGKWSICSKRANAPFSIIFSNSKYFKGVKRRYYGVKG